MAPHDDLFERADRAIQQSRAQSRSRLAKAEPLRVVASDEFRANAVECRRMADLTASPDEKRIWLEMAELWSRMITDAEPAERPEV